MFKTRQTKLYERYLKMTAADAYDHAKRVIQRFRSRDEQKIRHHWVDVGLALWAAHGVWPNGERPEPG